MKYVWFILLLTGYIIGQTTLSDEEIKGIYKNIKLLQVENDSLKQINNILLGKIPIIVKSKYCVYKNNFQSECKYDLGGHVIINGNEKVLITQEKIIPNIIQVYKNSKKNSKFKKDKNCYSLPQSAGSGHR